MTDPNIFTTIEIASVTVAANKPHRLALVVAALVGGLLAYSFSRSAINSDGLSISALLSGFFALVFGTSSALKLWVAITGLLPRIIRTGITSWLKARALKSGVDLSEL